MPGRLETFFWEARNDSGTSRRGHKGKCSHPHPHPPLFSSWPGAATSYTAADIQAALLKQIRASKKKTILVKRPQQEHVKFMDFGEPMGWAQRGPPGAEPSLAAGSVGQRMGAPLLLAHTTTSRASKQPPLSLLTPTPTSFPPFSGAFCKAPTPPCSLLPSRLDPQALHHHRHHHHGHHHGPGHHPQVHHGLGSHHGSGFAPGRRGSSQHQAARPPEHPETQLHAARRPSPQAPRHQEAPAPLRLPPLPARGHLRGRRAGFHLQLPGGQRGGRLRET